MPLSGTVNRGNSRCLSANTAVPSVNDGGHQLVPYGEDPIAVIADRVIHDHADRLPDLTSVTVLVGAPQGIAKLRQHLLRAAGQHGCSALLGPCITSLRDYVAEHYPAERAIVGEHARELMLYKALRQYPDLFANISPWHVLDNLLGLFDELSARQVSLPAGADSFGRQLAAAYGLAADYHSDALGREASIVHTLWHAYRAQLDAHQLTDTETAYIDGLEQFCKQPPDTTFYVCGYQQFLPSELLLLQTLSERRQLTLILQGQYLDTASDDDGEALHPDLAISRLAHHFSARNSPREDAYSRFLNAAFAPCSKLTPMRAIQQRARDYASAHAQSPAKPRLRLCRSANPENEAQAVALQLAHWRRCGKQRLGIISEDRRLARRVRALVERYGLTINDYSGWALSTTSAAAALENWLNVIEQDFAYQPLLDLLKSPFALPDWPRDTLSKTAFRFEQDIVRHENILANLQRYRFYIRSRQQRLQWQDNNVSLLLDRVEDAAQSLLAMAHSTAPYPLSELFSALELSLQKIGLMTSLQKDGAGQCLLEKIRSLCEETCDNDNDESMSWREFRRWLARLFENTYFQPANSEHGVALLSLAQSGSDRFDGLIIAAADQRHLPALRSPSALFNEGVRRQLGLRTLRDAMQTDFYHFRRLLEAAPEVVVTLCDDASGEPQALSPWLEIINVFHTLAYQDDLYDGTLAKAANAAAGIIQPGDNMPSRSGQPAPQTPPALPPSSYSAYSYQQLIDCPYRYFASQCLRLSPPEEIREALQKSGYGEHVHRCLQAFHSEVKGLPGPFTAELSSSNRQQAIALLEAISQRVFFADLEDNFIHHVWLRRWQRLIPNYIDWQITRSGQWQVIDTEHFMERRMEAGNYSIKGRIDRVDRGPAGETILDYKTGSCASLEQIIAGESIQLPFYALLWQQPLHAVEYLQLGSDGVRQICLDEDALQSTVVANQQRLSSLDTQLRSATPLPAWGDDDVCRYCEMQGVCRKQSWSNPPPTT